MKRYCFLLLITLLSALGLQKIGASVTNPVSPVNEEDAPNAISVLISNGNVFYYALTEKPILKYTLSEVVISTKGEFVTFKKDAIDEIEFVYNEDIATAIEDIQSTGVIRYVHQVISVSNYKSNTVISVVGLDGRLYNKTLVGQDGTASVSLRGLPTGVYVVRVGNDDLKIQK